MIDAARALLWQEIRNGVSTLPAKAVEPVLIWLDRLEAVISTKDAEIAPMHEALVEVGDFLADDCVENYPFDRIPGSFADEADRLLKLIKQLTDKQPAPEAPESRSRDGARGGTAK